MGRHKELKSVANDLIQSLNSRNNDYLGYWATGQLCGLAKDHSVSHVRIDVLNNEMEPYSEHFKEIFNVYREKVEKQIEARKLKINWVSSFILEYKFEQEEDKSLHRWVGVGKPYIISVLMESDLGRSYKGRVGGYCRLHDAKREQRRNGF